MVIEHRSKKFDERRTMGEVMETMSAVGSVAGTEDVAALVHPPRAALDLAEVLHALSDPMRLRIVAALAAEGGERTCNSFDLPIVKSTCTHHFKVLREAGLIRQRVTGTKRVNSLRREDIDARFPGLLDAVLKGVDETEAP
jgi:DNA-binding transcriptional ArsR family regulator